jgi:hypothetical protein
MIMTQESGATSASNTYLQNDDIVLQQTFSNQCTDMIGSKQICSHSNQQQHRQPENKSILFIVTSFGTV